MITQQIHISSIYYPTYPYIIQFIIHISSIYYYYPYIIHISFIIHSITTISHYQRVPMADFSPAVWQSSDGSLPPDSALPRSPRGAPRTFFWQNMGDFTMDNDVFTSNVELCVIFSIYIYIWYMIYVYTYIYYTHILVSFISPYRLL